MQGRDTPSMVVSIDQPWEHNVVGRPDLLLANVPFSQLGVRANSYYLTALKVDGSVPNQAILPGRVGNDVPSPN